MLKVVFTIIGTFIGAGFASGKEIHLFFFRFGFLGIIGIIISSFFISIILLKTLKIIKKNNIKNYENFLNKIIKYKIIKKILNKIICIFLAFSFCVMISGFCSFFKQEFNINKVISGILILSICYFVFQKNINKIIKINNFLMPIIILIILYILFIKNNNFNFYFLKNNYEKNNFYYNFIKNNYNKNNIFYNILKNIFTIKNKFKFVFFIKAILYSNYNLLAIIPIFIAIKKYINKKAHEKIIPIIVGTIICILSLCIFLLLSSLVAEKQIEMLIALFVLISKY